MPHRSRIVSQRVLAPGCAVECCVDYGEEARRACGPLSVYLPPGPQGDTLEVLWDALPPQGSALVVAGDFNIEVVQPRTEGEAGLRDKLFAWYGKLGISPVPGSGHTKRGRKGNACIDAIAVAEGQAWRWRVAKAWKGDLCDHARLQLVAGGRASVGRACAPAAMRSLPPAALVDLRRVLFHVGLALGGQARGRVAGRGPDDGGSTMDLPAKPGDLPALHPALGIACEGQCGSSCPVCCPRGASAHGQKELCHPPGDRRRARGTLRAIHGTAIQRTRGRAGTRPAEQPVRDSGRARGPSSEGGGIGNVLSAPAAMTGRPLVLTSLAANGTP